MKAMVYRAVCSCVALCSVLVTVGALRRGFGQAGTKRGDGATLVYSPGAPNSSQNVVFSPDGQSIVFSLFKNGYNGGPAGLYLLTIGTNQPVALVDDGNHDHVNVPGTSTWNRQTNRIVFSSDRSESPEEIWTIDATTQQLSRVTQHTTSDFYIEPSLSPDGTWITFEVAQGVSEKDQQGTIWKIRVDGGGLTQLTGVQQSQNDDRLPNWSPRGDLIVFQRRVLGSDDWDLYTMGVDGSAVSSLITSPSSDTDPSWSPDGSYAVFSSTFGSLPTANIFVIKSTGGTPIRVTRDSGNEDSAPGWSQDGEWIGFESHDGNNEDSPASIWRIPSPVEISSGTSTTHVPQVAWGGSFETHLAITNTADTEATGNVSLWDSDGNPGVATFTGPGANPRLASFSAANARVAGSSFSFSIPPGGTRFLRISGLNRDDSTKTGWATIEATGRSLDGVAIFEEKQGSILKTSAGVLFSQPVQAATIPVDNDATEGRFVGFAVAYPGNGDLTLRLLTVDQGGTVVDNLLPPELAMVPGGQIAIFLHEIVRTRTTFKGSMVLVSQNGEKFLVTALIQNKGLFTAIPVVVGKSSNLPN